MAEQDKPKKYVLIRAAESGKLFVVGRTFLTEIQGMGSHRKAEVVAEADEMLSLMRFKALTEET